MIKIEFYYRNQSFFHDNCNKLWEYLKLNKKDWDEFISSCKFDKDDLIDMIDSMNAESEIMSKKIYNFTYNIDIDFSISRHERNMIWNCINLSIILWISKWEKASAIQLFLNEIHIKKTSIS